MNMGPAPEVVVCMTVAPASVCFHTLLFSIVVVCLKLNEKWIISSRLHKFKRIYQTFLSNLIWQFFLQAAPIEEISEKTTNTGSDDSESNY